MHIKLNDIQFMIITEDRIFLCIRKLRAVFIFIFNNKMLETINSNALISSYIF